MSKLVLSEATVRDLAALQRSASHAIIIAGRAGSGKAALARQFAETMLDLPADGFSSYGYGLTIRPLEGKAISIEQIRELEHFLSLKVPRSGAVNRAVIIEDAHTLTVEAQNALLKTLEEPPAGTILILTAVSGQALLPTIRSRARSIHLQPPARRDMAAYFKEQAVGEAKIDQAYAISGGLPGLMHALVSEDDHPLLAATEKARAILGAPLFERLLMVDELAKQRPLVADTLFILEQMATISLQSAQGPAAARWRRVLTASFKARQALAQNAQPKLALTNLMLSL